MGSLVHDIIYVEKYTLEIAHEKIYEDRNRPVMCGIVSMRHHSVSSFMYSNIIIPPHIFSPAHSETVFPYFNFTGISAIPVSYYPMAEYKCQL